jgi:molybdopterin molybdotransferase
MTEVADAERLIFEHLPKLAVSREPLSDCVERVLAEDVTADRDQPPFDRVTMDGIAIAGRDWESGVRAFEIAGTQAAGAPPLALGGPARCVEVMTGAMLPRGADTVIPVERITRNGSTAAVDPRASVASGQYVHPRGSDRKAGDLLLAAGTRIGPPEIAVLASAGRSTVPVASLPHVAIVSTGDELVDVDAPLAEYQVRSSNDRAIEATLLRARLARVTRARLRDDAATLRAELATLLERADVLVLSGGVSMGQFDLVPGALSDLGAERVFHRVRQRPGKPMWFGVGARGQPIFALPGNPVSTLICATRYLVPALWAAAGLAPRPAEHVTLAAPAEGFGDLAHFMPVKLAWSSEGAALAKPCRTNTSGDFAALAGTDGFVELAPRRGEYAQGTAVRLFRW